MRKIKSPIFRKEQAVRVFAKYVGVDPAKVIFEEGSIFMGGEGIVSVQVTDFLPGNCNPYFGNPVGKCWYILCAYNLHAIIPEIRSSRLVCISKTTGQVVHDGSACDEG